MKYIVLRPKNRTEKILFDKIDRCTADLYNMISSINLNDCGLSDYNQRYIQDYLNEYIFYSRFYTQVLITAIRELDKPIEESVFVDYGGGNGFFSLLAKLTGFKTVIYNDIYDVSVTDAKIISKETGIKTDYFICGDIDKLVSEIEELNITPDLVCSFEVIEHIYNLNEWFEILQKMRGNFSLVSSSSANIKNLHISKRLKSGHLKAEYKGTEINTGTKKRDSARPFFEIRKDIISNIAKDLDSNQIDTLAKLTRGLNKKDIEYRVGNFLELKKEIKPIKHPTNTCDPLTGNWSENLINHKWLKKIIAKNGFERIKIRAGLYTYSENIIAMIFKRILNIIINMTGNFGLYFSPIYILTARKKSENVNHTTEG